MQVFDSWFFNYNAFTSVLMLSMIPIAYLLCLYYNQRDFKVIQVLLPTIISIEILIYGMWFVAVLPVFIWIKAVFFITTGNFLWVLPDFILILFFVVYIASALLLPKRLTNYLIKTYQELEKEYSEAANIENPYETSDDSENSENQAESV